MRSKSSAPSPSTSSTSPSSREETLETKLPGVGILVVRSKEVTRKAIEGARQLNLIVRAGAETATIDVKAASERGIYVANCPGKNSSAVAELVFGLLVSIDRRIPDAVASLRAGRWERTEYAKAEGLIGKTIGIAGLGAIGRDVAQRARRSASTPSAGAAASARRAPPSSASVTPRRSRSSRRSPTSSPCTSR